MDMSSMPGMDHGSMAGMTMPAPASSAAKPATKAPAKKAKKKPVSAPPAPASHTMDDMKGMDRSEEHTSELQSLMRNSYAVFCLKKKNTKTTTHNQRRDDKH